MQIRRSSSPFSSLFGPAMLAASAGLSGLPAAAIAQPVEVTYLPIPTASTEKTAMTVTNKVAGLANGSAIVVGTGLEGNPSAPTGPTNRTLDFFITRMNANGTMAGMWRLAESPTEKAEVAWSCAARVIDEEEIVVVGGLSVGGEECHQENAGVIFRLGSNGSAAWARRIEGSANLPGNTILKPPAVMDVCIGDDGSVYAGTALQPSGIESCQPDCGTFYASVTKLSGDGTHQWTKRIANDPINPEFSRMNIVDIEPLDEGVLCLSQVILTSGEGGCGSETTETRSILFALDGDGVLVNSIELDSDLSLSDVASSVSVNNGDYKAVVAILKLSLSQDVASNSTSTVVVGLGTPFSLGTTHTQPGVVVNYASLVRDADGDLWGAGTGIGASTPTSPTLAAIFRLSLTGEITSGSVFSDNFALPSQSFYGLSWGDDNLWSVGATAFSTELSINPPYVLETDASLVGSCSGLPAFLPEPTEQAEITPNTASLSATNGASPTTITLSAFAVNSETVSLCDSISGCPLCVADFDRDGDADSDDITAFFAAWNLGDPCADADGDSDADSDDVTLFFVLWDNGGC